VDQLRRVGAFPVAVCRSISRSSQKTEVSTGVSRQTDEPVHLIGEDAVSATLLKKKRDARNGHALPGVARRG
jgi:hypothetical protein